MERTRTLGAGIDSLTWRRLASGRNGRDGRHRLGGPAPVRAVDSELAPPAGARSAARSDRARRTAPRRGLRPGHAGAARLAGRCVRRVARIARTGFAPAMRRFDDAIAALAKEQDRIAQAAQQRTWLGWLGSLTIGLLLLCMLGWRLHRIQRRSAVAEQARDAERRGDERLHALVRHSSDVVAVIDGECAHSAGSRTRCAARWGTDPADVFGHPVARPRPPRRRRRHHPLPGADRAEARTCRLAEPTAARRRRRPIERSR